MLNAAGHMCTSQACNRTLRAIVMSSREQASGQEQATGLSQHCNASLRKANTPVFRDNENADFAVVCLLNACCAVNGAPLSDLFTLSA
jgi:hypothetical protein